MDVYRSLYDRCVLKRPSSVSFQFAATPECVANLVQPIARTTFGYNSQLQRYLQSCNAEQAALLQRTNQFMSRISASTTSPTATLLRDKGTWSSVKRLVVRKELMKAQITGKIDLPILGADKRDVLNMIGNKDLSNFDDAAVDRLIDRLISTDDQQYLNALIRFKDTGQTSSLIQQSKLSELSKELQGIDLKHITHDEYKHLLENYCERIEFHHRESISSNPQKQSVADNVEPLKTSAHDGKHTDSETGKIDYRKPLDEEPLTREDEMVRGNKRRVLKNELQGLALAAAIGFGVGFTLSFLSEIAQHGIVSEEMGDIVFDSIIAGTETGIVASATYVTGRLLTSAIEKAGVDIASKFGMILNTAAVGLLSTAIVCVYQYVKLRTSGYNVDESLSAVTKTAITSLSLLAISIVAQGVCGGPAGVIVSTSVGVLYFSTTLYKSAHDRKIELQLREYTIEEYRSLIDRKQIITIS